MTPVEFLLRFRHDPLGFVTSCFPWEQPGTELERFYGPEPWQVEVLTEMGNRLRSGTALSEAIRLAVASGHGVGKSALVAWIMLWAISTFEDTRGVVTANTENQLKTKTWAELGKWHRLFFCKEMFQFTATALLSAQKDHERTWRIDMVPWSENNTEAFAGLHNQGKRILLIFDEGSAIDDRIYEVSEGALTDLNTEIIWCVYGNPTRNVGRFRECFAGGRFAHLWWTKQVDSRTISFTNKRYFEEMISAYGEDSDWVRIRCRGIFPRTGEMEFISSFDVDSAMEREAQSNRIDPLIIGVDVARYGTNESVIYFRKGRDGRTIEPRRFRGLSTVELASRVAEAFHEFRADAIFVDGGGVGGGVVDQLRALQLHCFDIQFGAKDDSPGYATGNEGERYANKRAAMWGAMRAWMKLGAIPQNIDLRGQLIAPSYMLNQQGAIQLERKEDMMKRGVDSPDIADALALTFAYPVAQHELAGGEHIPKPLVESEYDPFAPERMVA